MTGAQLDAELADPLAAGAFEVSLRQRAVVAAIKASPVALGAIAGSGVALHAVLRQDISVLDAIVANDAALTKLANGPALMDAVAASPAAMNAVAASPAAMNAVAASPAAMDAVAASSSFMDACLANTVARNTFYNSDTALTAIAGSATAKAAMRAAAGYTIVTQSVSVANIPITITGITGPCLMVGWSISNTGNITLTGRRAGSAVGALTAPSGTIQGTGAVFDNVMAITAPATVTNTVANRNKYVGIVPV